MIPDSETSVIAAIGELNSLGEANAHLESDTSDIRIDFSSNGVQRCSAEFDKLPETTKLKPWTGSTISNNDTFYFKIGPTGGEKGYSALTSK